MPTRYKVLICEKDGQNLQFREELDLNSVNIFFDKTNTEMVSEDVESAIKELYNSGGNSVTPGVGFSRRGQLTGTQAPWLLAGDNYSNITGQPFGYYNGELKEIWTGNQDLSTYGVSVYYHYGDETNLTLLTTVSVVNSRIQSFSDTDFGLIQVPKDSQLAVRIVSGTCKDVSVFLNLAGTKTP